MNSSDVMLSVDADCMLLVQGAAGNASRMLLKVLRIITAERSVEVDCVLGNEWQENARSKRRD